jgi:hypothetical protein
MEPTTSARLNVNLPQSKSRVWRSRRRVVFHQEDYARRTFCGRQFDAHEYTDGRLEIFEGPRCLARFDAKGGEIDEPASATWARPHCPYPLRGDQKAAHQLEPKNRIGPC